MLSCATYVACAAAGRSRSAAWRPAAHGGQARPLARPPQSAGASQAQGVQKGPQVQLILLEALLVCMCLSTLWVHCQRSERHLEGRMPPGHEAGWTANLAGPVAHVDQHVVEGLAPTACRSPQHRRGDYTSQMIEWRAVSALEVGRGAQEAVEAACQAQSVPTQRSAAPFALHSKLVGQQRGPGGTGKRRSCLAPMRARRRRHKSTPADSGADWAGCRRPSAQSTARRTGSSRPSR